MRPITSIHCLLIRGLRRGLLYLPGLLVKVMIVSWHPVSCASADEAGNVETDRSLRSLLSARRSEEDMSTLMHAALHPQARKQHAWEPMTPQETAEGTRLFPSQAWLLSHTVTASCLCCVIMSHICALLTKQHAMNSPVVLISCCFTLLSSMQTVQCTPTVNAHFLLA